MAAKKTAKKKVSPAVHDELRRVRAAVDQANAGAPDGTPKLQLQSREEFLSERSEQEFTPATPGVETISNEVAPVQSAPSATKRGPGRPRKAETAAVTPIPPSPAAAGAAPREIDLPDVLLTEQQMSYLLQLTGSFSTYAVALSTKLPVEKVGEIWRFTEKEIDTIAPPATKVANKHLPWWLKHWADEIGLLIVLLPILTAKMATTIALRAQLAAAEAKPVAPAKPNGGAIHTEAEAHA